MAKPLLRFVFFFPIILSSIINANTGRRVKSSNSEFSKMSNRKDCPKLALLLYHKKSVLLEDNFGRQYNQTLTLIKSLVITMEEDDCVHVILISNKKFHFKNIKNQVFKWDSIFTRRIQLEFVPHKYPKEQKWMKNIYRPGSTLGIFLPEILPYDAVIFADTDILFFRSISHLWAEMSSLNSPALLSACIRLMPTWFIDIPVIHETGLGAGVVLMNLTRMRERNWSYNVVTEAIPFLSKIKYGLEDFLNVYFHKFPEEVRLLSCDWNYWIHRCEVPCPDEDEGIKGGISILHGNTCAFMDPKMEPIFRSVYQVFADTNLTINFALEDLLQQLAEQIHLQKSTNPESRCAKSINFDDLLMKRLRLKLRSSKRPSL